MTIEERFAKAEQDYLRWKDDIDAGCMTESQLEEALDQTMIEHDGRWWMLGVNTGKWYVHEDERWLESTPPRAHRPASRPPRHPGEGRDPGPGTYLSWAGWALGALGVLFIGSNVGFVPTLVFVGWEPANLLFFAGAFLLGLSSALKRPSRVPWVAVARAGAWAGLGFVLVVGEDMDLGELWWLPEVLLPSGLANLAGVVVGIGANARRGRANA